MENRLKHTIELNGVVFDRLECSTTRPVLLSIAGFASLALHVEHSSHSWNRADDQNDDEGAKRPAPAGAVQEMFCDLRSSKCRGDSRGCIDAEDNHTVLERSDIGAHNIDDVQKTNMASPVKNVATDVGLNVRANSLDDHAKNTDQEHHAFA